MTKYLTISQISDLLRVPEHRIHYAHRSRKLEEPGYFFAGRRAYDASDVIRVAEHFGVDVPDKILEQDKEEREQKHRRLQKGQFGDIRHLIAIEEIVKELGIPLPSGSLTESAK
jgi:hypothetical protein